MISQGTNGSCVDRFSQSASEEGGAGQSKPHL